MTDFDKAMIAGSVLAVILTGLAVAGAALIPATCRESVTVWNPSHSGGAHLIVGDRTLSAGVG